MQEDAAKFWSDFEAETGERVAAKAIGTYFPPGGDERGLWGLLILTDASFRFKHFPNDNLIFGLFRPRGKAPRDEAVDLALPLGGIIALREERRGFLARLLGSAFPRFELEWREGAGARKGGFAADPSSDLMRLLRESAEGPHPA